MIGVLLFAALLGLVLSQMTDPLRMWPVDLTRWAVTSPYGRQRASGPHRGVDLAPRPRGSVGQVLAPVAGRIAGAGSYLNSANFRVWRILLFDGVNLHGLYHLDPGSLTVEPGDLVSAGQALATVGASTALDPLITAAHLHWQIKLQGDFIDPTKDFLGAGDTVV